MSLRLLLCLALCALPSVSFAKSRVAVLPFKDKGLAGVHAKLVKRLCRLERCVRPAKDGEANPVDAVVLGKAVKVKGRMMLELSIFLSEDEAPVKWRAPLVQRKSLSPKALGAAVQAIRHAVASEEGDDPSASLASSL